MATGQPRGDGRGVRVDGQLILDRYRPLSQLGEGGFGTVVLAWDTRMQRRVAIKRLRLPLDARGVPQRPPGLGEARTAAMLNHPAIVTVFDFDTDADEAFLVMEHVDGASLAQLIDSGEGPLTLDETAAVIDAVATALEFAHDNGVLHLDIKPENVLVTRDGRIKVADFGMAELSSLGGHGPAWGGTPGYMPLEQLEGKQVSARTDEWALAVLAFESLTGENPFAESSVEAAIVRLQTLDPPLPSEYEPDLPAAIDDVILAALGDRPQDRYDSVTSFADALLPLLGDVLAGRDSLGELVDSVAEPDDETTGLDSVGMWDRLGGRLGGLLLRLAAGVESAWLAWSGLTPFALDTPALAAGVGTVAVAGLLAPSLGVGLGVGCLVAGIFAAGSPLVAIAVLVGAAVWWWFLGRRSSGAAVLPLAAPVLAAVRIGFAQPLLAGFSLTPLAAAATGLLGGVLAALAAAVSASGPPYLDVWAPYVVDIWHADLALSGIRALATTPAAYVALAGWPLSAFIMSVACSRATRLGALVGAVGGTAALAGTYLLADLVSNGDIAARQWAGNDLAVALVASLILILLVAMLGPPIRAEKDDEPVELPAFED